MVLNLLIAGPWAKPNWKPPKLLGVGLGNPATQTSARFENPPCPQVHLQSPWESWHTGLTWAHRPSYLLGVDASGHGPGGNNIIHDSLTQALWHLVELQEVPNAVEHLMVPVGVGVHLLENGRHIPEDGGIQKSWGEETTREWAFNQGPRMPIWPRAGQRPELPSPGQTVLTFSEEPHAAASGSGPIKRVAWQQASRTNRW